MKKVKITKREHEILWVDANRPRETNAEEQRAVSYCLAMWAACEPVERDDYEVAMRAAKRLGLS